MFLHLWGNSMMSQNFLKRRIEEIKATAVSVGIDLQPERKDILFDDDIGTDRSGK